MPENYGLFGTCDSRCACGQLRVHHAHRKGECKDPKTCTYWYCGTPDCGRA